MRPHTLYAVVRRLVLLATYPTYREALGRTTREPGATVERWLYPVRGKGRRQVYGEPEKQRL